MEETALVNQTTKLPILKATGLSKSFYHPVSTDILKGINLEVYLGDTIAIMGRSGEGKSTLLHILGTLEPPCDGVLEIASQPVSSFNKNKIRCHHIGFIFQSFHLLEDYTVLDNVLMPARIARMATHRHSETYNKACELLDHVGLSSRLHFNTKSLSGGEKQRVAIARALCNDPDLILADEPSGNLDRQTAKVIHDMLLSFVKQKNKSLIVVTHDHELAALCHHIYHLREGRLEKQIR